MTRFLFFFFQLFLFFHIKVELLHICYTENCCERWLTQNIDSDLWTTQHSLLRIFKQMMT